MKRTLFFSHLSRFGKTWVFKVSDVPEVRNTLSKKELSLKGVWSGTLPPDHEKGELP